MRNGVSHGVTGALVTAPPTRPDPTPLSKAIHDLTVGGGEAKICNRCQRELPLSSFYRMSAAPDGRQYCCIECRKTYNHDNAHHIRPRERAYLIRTGRQSDRIAPKRPLPRGDSPAPRALREYGITPADYEALLVAQGFRCAICLTPPVGKRLAVDHDHATGVVRGLLCARCNLTLGLLEDSPAMLRAATTYLESSRSHGWLAPLAGSL